MKVKCPACKKEVQWKDNPFRPFCSERCQLLDLGDWASGNRAIPGNHDPSAEETQVPNQPASETEEED